MVFRPRIIVKSWVAGEEIESTYCEQQEENRYQDDPEITVPDKVASVYLRFQDTLISGARYDFNNTHHQTIAQPRRQDHRDIHGLTVPPLQAVHIKQITARIDVEYESSHVAI